MALSGIFFGIPEALGSVLLRETTKCIISLPYERTRVYGIDIKVNHACSQDSFDLA